jgi:prepilin-type N-terminal cleavage/methylation domain-containing protein
MTRRGFSFIELLITLIIVGILANLVVPGYGVLKRRAEAAHIVGDMHAIRIAALSTYATTGQFPPSAAWGETPAAFAPALPQGFEFQYKTALYRWRQWPLPEGSPGDASQTVMIGLEIQTEDEALIGAVKALYRGNLTFGTPTQATFVLQ